MPRACSKLVMLLLMLSVASPALAAGKKKKAAADKAEAAEEAAPSDEPSDKKEGKSTDDLMGDATKPSATKPSATADGASGDAPADAELATQEAPAEPDSWERPPEEAEKPKKEVSALVDEAVGDGRPLMAGLVVGYGLKTDTDTGSLPGSSDPYGLTAGLRGGYTLDFNLYVGVFFAYYLGGSATGRTQRTLLEGSSAASSLQFGAEAGYDFWLSDVILRPSLQLGGQFAFTDVDGDKRTTGDFIAGPGLGLFVPIDGWFIGGEVRPVLPFANAPVMVLLGAQVGLRFK